MKTAIFSFVRLSENSMVASIRIARFLAKKLGVQTYDYKNIHEIEGKRLDLLIIVNGAYGFCQCLPELAALVKSARRIVWVQNDYTIIPPKIESKGVSPFRAAFRERHEAGKPHMDFWTTCEDWARFTPASLYVNWNALTFDESYSQKKIVNWRTKATEDLLYYGSYRGGSGKSSRERYFDRYFREPLVKTTISSPAKQFHERYTSDKIVHVDALKNDFYRDIGVHGLGLYIEDRMSHERFHSPANRFYEMLSAGLPMVFQPECGSMMRRAGYDPEPFFVSNVRDVKRSMDIREEIGPTQRRVWIGDDPGKFRRKLNEQIDSAMQAQMDEVAA